MDNIEHMLSIVDQHPSLQGRLSAVAHHWNEQDLDPEKVFLQMTQQPPPSPAHLKAMAEKQPSPEKRQTLLDMAQDVEQLQQAADEIPAPPASTPPTQVPPVSHRTPEMAEDLLRAIRIAFDPMKRMRDFEAAWLEGMLANHPQQVLRMVESSERSDLVDLTELARTCQAKQEEFEDLYERQREWLAKKHPQNSNGSFLDRIAMHQHDRSAAMEQTLAEIADHVGSKVMD